MHAVMNWGWQGGVVAVAASLLLLTLRRTSASARSGVCWGAWLLVLALPVLYISPAGRRGFELVFAIQGKGRSTWLTKGYEAR